MKSIEFVKERIKNGFADVPLQEDAKFSEVDFMDFLETQINQFFEIFEDNRCQFQLKGTATTEDGKEQDGKLTINIIHNEDEDFEYFTMERCSCDGTYIFMTELMQNVFKKLAYCKTINNEKVSSDFNNYPFDYEICYTVGNFVVCNEYGDFGTEEKPWMKSRFTVMLPIKFDITKKS